LKIIRKVTAILAAVLLFILTALPVGAVATDLELVGEAAGLVLVPAEGKLFNLENMGPGDTRQATIKLRNDYSEVYHLWMWAEDLADREPGLLEILELTVLYRGKALYRGPVANFAGAAVYLGRFRPGESGELVATVRLPGPETGNEYQGKSAPVKWIFIAQASEEIVVEPEPPGISPEEPPGKSPGGSFSISPEPPGISPEEPLSPDLPRTYGAGGPGFYFLLGSLALLAGTPLARRCKGC